MMYYWIICKNWTIFAALFTNLHQKNSSTSYQKTMILGYKVKKPYKPLAISKIISDEVI